ncbi:hypothetical protein RclHR1_00030030 [Rhizophagus clarus]|uniref:UvrD-like helicase C-terminal domain-containing protein n=1 Tax=Rhizophagus clarus TaxID=94130 RepID=A0A2Z6R5J3_9GLOM|nr:hypothetical protein RclHR1_00030030 [Rhizophagus clarus]
MDAGLIINLLDDFNSESKCDDGQKWEKLLKWCINASKSDLDKFLAEISSSLDIYLSNLIIFTSYLCNKYLQVAPNIKNIISLVRFISLLITVVIMGNLQNSDIIGFSELLHNCIVLLWWADNKDDNNSNLVFQNIFSEVMKANVLEVLISEVHGYNCLKRMLFDFNMINRIDQLELLKAVDLVAALVEKCPEHKNDLLLSKGFTVNKACSTLLETLPPMFKIDNEEQHWNGERADSNFKNNLRSLSDKYKQYFALLRMKLPRKPSDLPHLLRALKEQKIDSFKDLIGFFPCTSCHKQALNYIAPDKYFLEDESVPSRCFRLPFEFNDDDRLGPWDILLSSDTIKDLQILESNPDLIRMIMKKLGQISSGKWNMHELRCTVRTSVIPVYEVVLPDNGLKILWQVDYGFSIRSNSFTQLVKVWAITTDQNQIEEVLRKLLILHQVYTLNQRHRCTVELEDGVILPMILGDEEDTEERLCSSRTEDELLMIHEMLVTNKFFPLSTNLYKSLVFGGLKFTFQVSKKEYEIINYPTSAIIIGRSGTGKSTCILYRQIASYLSSQLDKKLRDNNRNFYKRQIFITVSPTFRHKMMKDFRLILESAKNAGKKMSMTQFNEYRKEKGKESAYTPEMYEEKDEEEELNSIPDTFNHLQLTDEYFPLFITFGKFSKMLQGTFGINNRDLIIQKKLNADNVDSYIKKNSKKSFINIADKNFVKYKTFNTKYWPSLRDYCKKKFECGLVYSEFSIIKGTNPDVDFLSREDYRSVSIKKYPAFCYNRDLIYDLFQKYEKMKARNCDYDSMDRTLAIFRCAKKKSLGSLHIHEVYIDECQDNNIVDLALILRIFDRVNSIFLAGDIAQCIAKGSSFRFQDLRALMYQWELTRIQTKHHSIVKPKQFDLNINYRSHDGILQLAASVIDLIKHFFPDSIDHDLSRERAEVSGPIPIFDGEFQEDVFSVFKKRQISFGHSQVIIVRDDKTKLRLKKLIGRGAIVMTVFDAKGMEFNDVLLYNFFTGSLAPKKWRVIPPILGEDCKSVQTFFHEKHYILSSEFKHLYVAVTRAKQRLLICDEEADCNTPIREYWKQLVKKQKVDEEALLALAKKSDSREWDEQGKDFFEQRQYEQAKDYFEISGNRERYKLANAYHLRQIARDSINDSNDDTIKSNFNVAAVAFKECSRPNMAILCYQEVSMYKEAGDIYAEQHMFEYAAQNYRMASMWYEAGEYFEKAKKYDNAALAYEDGRLYEIAADFILRYKQEINSNTYQYVADHVKIHYRTTAISYGKFEEAIEIYIKLIDNEEDIIKAFEFLLYVCRIKILKETMTHNTSSDDALRKYLGELKVLIMRYELRSMRKTEKWNELIEEFSLYSAYLDKDIDKVYRCIQFFKHREILATEFHAMNIWLQILQLSGIQANYQHRERLHYLLRMCELVFSLIENINNKKEDHIKKNFEDVFCIVEVNNLQKRQIPFASPLLDFENKTYKNRLAEAEEVMNDQHHYDVNDVYQRISQCLILRIFELIKNADQRGRDIPDISSRICYMFTSCQKPGCRNHHVIPTPSILCQRLEFVIFHYTVMMKLDVNILLRDNHLLKNEQIIEEIRNIRNLQKWWTERLVKIHVRHKSPQISCPEATHMIIANLAKFSRDRFVDCARKTWLVDAKYINNFEVMLKCAFVFHRLQDRRSINNINWEMSKPKILSNSYNLPIGFEYKGHNKAMPVGNRLSAFFFYLYFNDVINAISNIKIFIQYAIDNAHSVNIVTSDAFGDLVSLMEFTVFLIFAIKPGYFEFCIPRAYLINYFEAFTTEPLIPGYQYNYNRVNYLVMIKYSFKQVQQLLNYLIREEMVYLSIILRLIRLLILISINEPKFATEVIIYFKYLNRRVISAKVKQYLNKKSMEQLTNVLYNDLKETSLDSLVIVHYHVENSKVLSKFSNLEKNDVMKLTYRSTKEFRSALQRIKSPIKFREKVTTVNKLQIWFRQIGQSQNAIRKLQGWFRRVLTIRKIQTWNCRIEATKKIQVWIRRIYRRVKSRKPDYDPMPDKIYNDMTNFCAKEINKKSKKKYIILLKGQTVDVVVKLISLYRRMETIINNISQDKSESNQLELLRNYHNKVNQALKSLSVTGNSVKHKKIDIKWLKNELLEAEDIINQVHRLEAATKKIQVWIRRIYRRVKSRKPDYDPMPDKIYNDMTNFCKIIAKGINKKSKKKCIMLLKGQTVDIVVELNSLHRRFINYSSDINRSNQCLELEDELRDYHKKVEQTLKSLSITENSPKLEVINIQWLENELQEAKVTINQFQKLMDKYKFEANSST